MATCYDRRQINGGWQCSQYGWRDEGRQSRVARPQWRSHGERKAEITNTGANLPERWKSKRINSNENEIDEASDVLLKPLSQSTVVGDGAGRALHNFQSQCRYTRQQSPRRCKIHWDFVGIAQASMNSPPITVTFAVYGTGPPSKLTSARWCRSIRSLIYYLLTRATDISIAFESINWETTSKKKLISKSIQNVCERVFHTILNFICETPWKIKEQTVNCEAKLIEEKYMNTPSTAHIYASLRAHTAHTHTTENSFDRSAHMRRSAWRAAHTWWFFSRMAHTQCCLCPISFGVYSANFHRKT